MTRFVTSVSPKGQVTIPVEIRREFGIDPKDRVEFEVMDNKIVVRRIGSAVDALYGSVTGVPTVRAWKDIERTIAEEIALNAFGEGRPENLTDD